jgi:hypothetical protein
VRSCGHERLILGGVMNSPWWFQDRKCPFGFVLSTECVSPLFLFRLHLFAWMAVLFFGL